MDKENSQRLAAKRQELQRQMRQTMQDERRAIARERREATRAAMTPEDLVKDAELDALYARAFGTDDGKLVLADLEKIRPIVAETIKERIARATNVG